MRFRLEMDCDNAAFGEEADSTLGDAVPEIVRILGRVMKGLEAGADSGSIMDVNGNKVGTWEIEE
jgi:hypothetical protein